MTQVRISLPVRVSEDERASGLIAAIDPDLKVPIFDVARYGRTEGPANMLAALSERLQAVTIAG